MLPASSVVVFREELQRSFDRVRFARVARHRRLEADDVNQDAAYPLALPELILSTPGAVCPSIFVSSRTAESLAVLDPAAALHRILLTLCALGLPAAA
jgi:hypothetical protein